MQKEIYEVWEAIAKYNPL